MVKTVTCNVEKQIYHPPPLMKDNLYILEVMHIHKKWIDSLFLRKWEIPFVLFYVCIHMYKSVLKQEIGWSIGPIRYK